MEQTDISSSYDRAKAACDAIPGPYYSTFRYFDTSMLISAEKQHYIKSPLDTEISEQWREVYYQPIIRSSSGRVCDEEALARWIDPEKGFLSPGEFIPVLENAKLAYKLDFYVLDRILEKLDYLEKEGFDLVPQSLNISRSDFEVCDVVEEIWKRVDAAGINPEMITIEITESVIGNDPDMINKQIERFQELGFPVWMDDFGSGYSSLNVLQSIKFNLIKFDMIFMKKLDEGVNGKIILTEMMKLATSLGVDTVCEGVETEEQVRFLQEIGCSKMQGYYFCKPIPLQQIFERYKEGRQIGFENPEESSYFETISRVNLFDLSLLANKRKMRMPSRITSIPYPWVLWR
jgi:EAL domain-containing protein (putative c-di-GMP-specific phosphodiesterase class I)